MESAFEYLSYNTNSSLIWQRSWVMVKFGAQDTVSNFMTKLGCAAVFRLASRCMVVESSSDKPRFKFLKMFTLSSSHILTARIKTLNAPARSLLVVVKSLLQDTLIHKILKLVPEFYSAVTTFSVILISKRAFGIKALTWVCHMCY